jgi:uncharacterized ubiquitin-like protein YukD
MILTLKIFVNGIERNIDVSDDTVVRDLIQNMLEETDSHDIPPALWEVRKGTGAYLSHDLRLYDGGVVDGDELWISPVPGHGG